MTNTDGPYSAAPLEILWGHSFLSPDNTTYDTLYTSRCAERGARHVNTFPKTDKENTALKAVADAVLKEMQGNEEF